MTDCRGDAIRAIDHIKNSEPFEFRTECLKEIVLQALYEGYKEWEAAGEVEWIRKLAPLVRMLSDDEKEYVASHVWKLSRKYYDYVSTSINIRIILDKIHR